MLRCSTAGYPQNLSFVKNSTQLYERQRLLLRLLSRRDALRVICAPSQYGKSVLAYHYAISAFTAEKVIWVNANEPQFLLALDSSTSSEFALRYFEGNDTGMLFVFDGCPYLGKQRFSALTDLIDKLQSSGHEALLTTQDTSWVNPAGLSVICINACELLLDEDEELCWPVAGSLQRSRGSNELSHAQEAGQVNKSTPPAFEEGFDLGCIPGFRQIEGSLHEAFLHSLMKAKIVSEQDALAYLALIIGSGALHELTMFARTFATTTIVYLERHYPHCGVKQLDPMFRALALSDDQKFALVQHHLSALTEVLSAFKDEDELLNALIECLLRRGEKSFAMQLVCGLHDDDRKAAYFDRYARKFILDAHPFALLKLAAALPNAFYSTLERWQLVIMALGLVNDGNHAVFALDMFQQRFCIRSATATTKDTVAAEFFHILARIIFEIEMEHDPAILLSCVQARIAQIGTICEHDMPSVDQCSYARDALMLIEQVLNDPYKALEMLDQIGSSGYTIKENLRATALYVQLLIHFWGERLFCEQELGSASVMSSGLRAAPIKGRTRKDVELLTRLERHIAQLLAHQESILAPNSYELFLFEKAYQLYGDRMYLLVSDSLLERIEEGRQSLIMQRQQWRTSQVPNKLGHLRAQRTPPKKQKKALRINTLGRFEIEPRDPSIIIKSKVRKQLRVLISLLVINEGREVSRLWIQRVMWPEAAERNAKQNLYSMWSLLNKSVTDGTGKCPFFESFPQSVALNEQLVETDVRLLIDLCRRLRNEQLEMNEYTAALDEIEDLYRGPLLPGIETAEVVAHRKRYQDHLVDALIQSGLRLRKYGNTELALRYFRFAFENEPTREDVCYQVMMSLWKLGRHGEALNEYFICRHALIEKYGVEGTSRLRELYESILRDAS